MGWILWIAAGLTGLVLLAMLVLLAPMRITASAAGAPAPRFRLGVGLLWGLVPPFHVVDSDRPPGPRRKKKRKRRAAQGKIRGKRWSFGRTDARRMIAALPGLLRGFAGAVRFERLEVDGRFGLSDPAATGELYGALSPFLYALPASERIRLAVVPDFAGAILAGRVEAALRFFPGGMLAAALGFAWRVFGPVR